MLFGSRPYLVVPLHPAANTKGPSRAPCRYPLHNQGLPFSVPPPLTDWTLLQNRSRDLPIRSLLPQGTSSLRVFRRDPNTMSSDGEGFVEAYSSVGRSTGYTEETLNLLMTAKQPPSYDGRVSWFRYEELVDDWVTFTTLKHAREDHFSRVASPETLTCTRPSSRTTSCKILTKESTISRTR